MLLITIELAWALSLVCMTILVSTSLNTTSNAAWIICAVYLAVALLGNVAFIRVPHS